MAHRPSLLSFPPLALLAAPQSNGRFRRASCRSLFLGLQLLFGACGGGGSSPTEPSPPPPVPTVASSIESGSVGRTDPGPLEYTVGAMIDVQFALKSKTDARVDVWLFDGSGEALGVSAHSLRISATSEDGKGGAYAQYHHTAKAFFPGIVREVRVVLTEDSGETRGSQPDQFKIVEKK